MKFNGISGIGLGVAAAGVLLVVMGYKDYTFTSVVRSAVLGEPLQSDSPQGYLKPIVKDPNAPPADTPATPDDGEEHGYLKPLFQGFRTGVDGINWGGSELF